MKNAEIVPTPHIYYKGMVIPKTDQGFKDKFEGGLKCGCPSNVVFFELKRWKAHVKGKRHMYFESTSIDTNEEIINYIKTIKQLKIEKGELAQKLLQSQNIIRELQQKLLSTKTKQIML